MIATSSPNVQTINIFVIFQVLLGFVICCHLGKIFGILSAQVCIEVALDDSSEQVRL